MTLNGTIRPATDLDASSLYEIRRDAIRLLAPRGMPDDTARRWADARTPAWVETILQERDIWVFESGGVLAG